MENGKIFSWQMTSPKEPFQKVEKPVPELKPGEVLVKVAGCGVCHTDLSFWYYGVQTRHELPLTLGHEISGRVVAGDSAWIGKAVIIPAVLPCGECDFCRKGRSNICRKQLMPGNDFDGGFASHVVVPSRFLCEVPQEMLQRYPLSHLSVIADAVSTPYQVVAKSELEAGDFAIVIGVGGIGAYGAQIARIKGAKVLALDINDEKLQMVKEVGIEETLNVKGMDVKAVKAKVKEIAGQLNVPRYGWKIYEMSGTGAGQELAFNLLTFGSTLSVVGFTMEKVNIRLSNLMAFDAKAIGTWGCRAELYPEIVELVARGKIQIAPFVQTFALDEINRVFQETLEHRYLKRSILVPEED